MSNQAVLDRVSDVIRAYPSIQVAWVFGSIANDTATPESDLDCAVLGPVPLAASIMQALINDLAEETGRPVDLMARLLGVC
jgi:predicted nucleotidyltransferase